MITRQRHNFIIRLFIPALLVAVLGAAMLTGCTQPAEVGKAVIAARVDAKITKVELEAMYPDVADRPAGVDKAIIHFQTISDLLKPAEAHIRRISPEEVDRP